MPNTIINLDNNCKAISLRFAWNTTNIGTGVLVGTLPANPIVLSVRTVIITAFNATGNDLLNSGITAGGNTFAVNADLSQAAGTVIDTTGRALSQSANYTVARQVWVAYTFSGTAPSAGEAQFTIEYLDLQTGTTF